MFSIKAAFYLLLTISSLFLVAVMYFQYAFTYWEKRGFPFEKPNFPFGNTFDLMGKIHLGTITKALYLKYKKLGHRFVGLYVINRPILILTDAELVKRVMTTDFHIFTNRGLYYNEESDPLSAHLVNIEGQKWKNLRTKLTPTFTASKMKLMFETILDCSLNLKDCLSLPVRTGEPIEIKDICARYTTDVIGSCAFGVECNSLRNPKSEFRKMGTRIISQNLKDKLRFNFSRSFPNLARKLNVRITNEEVETFIMTLFEDVLKQRNENNFYRKDFVQLLLEIMNNDIGDLTKREAAAQLYIFYIAGFETSSSAMSFCLYELSKNDDIQQKVFEEIIDVLMKYEGKITYESIGEMQYLDKVVAESLRMHPPFPNHLRISASDYKMPDTNLIIEKGTLVLIPAYGIHYDPEIYPNPDHFDPERFDDELSRKPSGKYSPFGDGPRSCIGMRFGLLQLKLGLIQLLTNYRFSLNPRTVSPLVIDPTKIIIFQSKGGIWLNVFERNV